MPQGFDAHITRRINAISAGLLRCVGDDISLLIQRYNTLDRFRGRCIPGKHKNAKGFLAPIFRHLSGGGIFVPGVGQSVFAGHFLYYRVIQHGDLLVIFRLICHGSGTSKVVFSDEDGHMTGKFRQEYTFLRRGIPTTDNKNLFSCKEFSIAGGTVGNAPALVCFLTFEPNCSGVGTGCHQDTKAAVVSLACMHRLDIPGKVKAGGFCQQKFRTEAFRLLLNGIRQGFAAGLGNAGIVDHLMGNSDLPAKLLFFQHQHPVFCPGQVKCGGQPRRAAADNDYII